MYSEKVLRHFKKPKFMGELKKYDGIGKVGNPTCGDLMHIYIKVRDDKIMDIRFQTFGCVAAIASSSMITQLAEGKELSKAEKIDMDEVVKSLKGLPQIKTHCGSMGAKALKLAIEDYRKHKLKANQRYLKGGKK